MWDLICNIFGVLFISVGIVISGVILYFIKGAYEHKKD